MRLVPVSTWASLGVFLVVVTSTLVYAAIRGVGSWRAFRSYQRTVGRDLAATVGRVEATEARLAGIAVYGERFDQARTRLTESIATAKVLASAAGEVQAAAGKVRALVPRR